MTFFQENLIGILMIVACIIVVAILTLGSVKDYDVGNPVCEKLSPSWATTSFYNSVSQICSFSNGLDSREVNYKVEQYFLIDFNHLGKQVLK